ncbi:MAG: hypothetical protein LBP64_04845 [Tannerella sp.]|jgi:hypothetical protein|nr:hypothetical protein [Tannerella sp.]
MKKYYSLLLGVAMVALVACGGGSKSSESTEQAAPEQTKVDEGASASKSSVLSEYEAFVEKAVPLLKKMKSGDTAAATEYAELAQKLSEFVTSHSEDFSALSGEDVKKYQELAQKLTDAAN